MPTDLHFGMCIWKYPSWRGLVYADAVNPNYGVRAGRGCRSVRPPI